MKNTLEMLKAYKVTSKYSSIKIIRLNKLDDCAISNVFVQQSKAKVSLRAVPLNRTKKKKDKIPNGKSLEARRHWPITSVTGASLSIASRARLDCKSRVYIY